MIKLRRQILTTIALLSIILNVWGNNSFSHLTIKDGLSQSTVKSIFQDSKGFLWFGSADGLNKFDGYSFTIFRNDPYNPFSIGGNDISCILESRSDSVLWIGTESSGLSRFNRENNTFFRFTENKNEFELPSNNIRAMVNSPDGKLWIATDGGGICWFNPEDSTFRQPEFSRLPEFTKVYSLAVDENGFLWLGCDRGLFRYDFSPTSVPQKIDLAEMTLSRINALLVDRRGFLWIGTQSQGVIRFQPDTKEIRHFTHNPSVETSVGSNAIRSILERKNGTIWIGSENGLSLYNSMNNNFKTFRNNPIDQESINDNSIFSMFEDNAGTIWLGTYFGGINKLYPEESRFSKYSNFHTIFDFNKAINHITGLYKDEKNTVWASTLKGLLSFNERYFEQPEIQTAINIFFENVPQRCVFGDSFQNLYVANDLGLFLRKEQSSDFVPLKPENLELTREMQNVMYVLEESDRNVCFLTYGGLVIYNPRTNTAELRNPRNEKGGIEIKYFISGIEAANGKIWLGTIDGELYRYDKYIYQFEKIIPHTDSSGTKPFNRIFSVCEQMPGIIWFGTDNGLYEYNEKENQLNRYMSSDGLANNVVYSVLTDSKQQIWCSTNKGISVYQAGTGSFVNYTWEDGLQSNEFNQNAYFKSKDGNIYLGGIDGFNIIDPEQIVPNQFIPPVHITGLTVNHEDVSPFSHPGILTKQISESREIVLNPKQRTFSLEFTALNFIHPQKNQYQYKLEGYDENWINEGTKRIAEYTNLNPGEYTFLVRGANNSGVWNPEPAKLKVVILPPFWQTTWFKLLFIVFVLLSVYLVFYLRMRAMRAQTQKLKLLVAEKTAALQETNRQIELQNQELSQINERVNRRNRKIEEKNNQLAAQNEQIARQRDKLLQLSEQLEEATQAKINFFTSISHEFRTPLTLITAPLKELTTNLESIGRDDIKRKLELVNANAIRLFMLINQLLDFRKIETGNMEPALSKQDIAAFLKQITALFNDLANRKQISLFTEVLPKEFAVCFDADKMEKILFNLLSNAFKHTPEKGEIKIKLEVLRAQTGNDEIQISVADSGPGIAEELLPFVFDDFWQANSSQAGSGIGLALVKKFAELHNGTVTVESGQGKGSCFTVTFPVVTDCKNAQSESPQANLKNSVKDWMTGVLAEYSPSIASEPKTVEIRQFPQLLIVEDDENIRTYMKELLSDRFRVLDAGTVSEGLELAFAESPDLILCDILLPDSTGYELCKKVKDEFKTCHIPVVLLTALPDAENQLAGLKCGADAYITKPFDVQRLQLTIENLIAQRKRLQAKFYQGINLDENEYASNPKDQEFLDKVIAEIEKHLNDASFDVETLCQAIGLSQPQTYRKIKALTDLSISEFIRNIRLKKAARLLAAGNLSVSEAAYEVGFSDPNYFSKCFVKVFGQTPTHYIKMKA